MGKYRILEQHGLNYLTLTIVGWIDIFSRQRYRDIVIESLKYCQEHKGLHINAFVIMSNHIHLVGYSEGHELSHVLRDFKKFTANQMLKAIKEEPESPAGAWSSAASIIRTSIADSVVSHLYTTINKNTPGVLSLYRYCSTSTTNYDGQLALGLPSHPKYNIAGPTLISEETIPARCAFPKTSLSLNSRLLQCLPDPTNAQT